MSAVIGITSLILGCKADVIERVNFPEGGCTGEFSSIMEQVGGKTVALCVEKAVAQLAACAKSVAIATDASSLTEGTNAGVSLPAAASGAAASIDTKSSRAATVAYSEAAPLLAARAAGLNACRRAYEKEADLPADEVVIELGRQQQRAEIFSTCMAGLEKLLPNETELRATIANGCFALLKPPHAASDARQPVSLKP